MGGIWVLESPVFDGAGVAMGIVDVGLDDGEVALDHGQGFVAEHPLEGVDIAAIAQKVDGKCVAEAVEGDAGDALAGADALEELAERVAVDVTAGAGGE